MPSLIKTYALWLAAIFAGTLVTLSLQPFGYWPLAIISSGILFLLVAECGYKKTLLLSLLFSCGMFFSGASWVYVSIHEFGNATIPFAALLTALFCLLLAICNALILGSFAAIKTKHLAINILVFAAIATSSEALRSWLFTGFPWLFVGYSQTGLILSGIAPLFGIYGLSFVIYASGAACALCLTRKFNTKSKLITLLATALIWAGSFALQQFNWSQTLQEPLRASLIQANISQHDKWRSEQFRPTLNLYAEMSNKHWANNNLIVWPEAAIPAYLHNVRSYIEDINETALKHNSALITGIPTAKSSASSELFSYNSVVGVGTANGTYHKQHLVPFGEYIPFYSLFGKLMVFFDLPLSRMQAGDPDQPSITVNDWRTRPLICYEMVYPGLVAKAAMQSDVLITLSNDSWFGKSLGPLQHLQMAQMRAIENARYVLRSTGNGVSAIINEKGKLVAKSNQFKREVLSGNFKLMQGLTPWSQYGYWLVHWLYGLPLCLRTAYLLFVHFRQ